MTKDLRSNPTELEKAEVEHVQQTHGDSYNNDEYQAARKGYEAGFHKAIDVLKEGYDCYYADHQPETFLKEWAERKDDK